MSGGGSFMRVCGWKTGKSAVQRGGRRALRDFGQGRRGAFALRRGNGSSRALRELPAEAGRRNRCSGEKISGGTSSTWVVRTSITR